MPLNDQFPQVGRFFMDMAQKFSKPKKEKKKPKKNIGKKPFLGPNYLAAPLIGEGRV